MKPEEIVAEASKLAEEDRASIASQLLDTLESPNHWVSDDEVAERVAEAESDPSVMITLTELKRGLKHSGA
ncbi:MAG: hypothetical protein ACSHX7_09860 [Luteolibacter sp.]